MGLFDSLPTPDTFGTILNVVMGDEQQSTGIAGVNQLLKSIDASNASVNFSAQLNGAATANLTVDTSSLTGGVLESFNQALELLPKDPRLLTAPFEELVTRLEALASDGLQGNFQGILDGMNGVEGLVPEDLRSLLASTGSQMAALKGEFISGSFGDLVAWSKQVDGLWQELRPVIEAGPDGLENRLIEWLREKLTTLAELILPAEFQGLSQGLARLGTAVEGDLEASLAALRADLATQLEAARQRFADGNFTDTAALSAAEAAFERLVSLAADLAARLRSLFTGPFMALDSIVTVLKKIYDYLAKVEIVDVGNIRDRFAKAISDIEARLRALDLGSARQALQGLFDPLNKLVDQVDFGGLGESMKGLQGQVQGLVQALDGALLEAVSTLRNLFTRLKAALRSALSGLGEFGPDGKFTFNVQQDLQQTLASLRDALQSQIRPQIEAFRTTLGQTLVQVRQTLEAVRGQVDQVRSQLQSAFDGVLQQLRSVDVPGTMESIRSEIDGMLNALGEVDFDPLVNPVIAQINEMRDTLAGIDVSSLSEVTVGALKVSVQVVVQLDFSTQVTGTVMAEFDELLAIPRQTIDQVEARIESALARLDELDPKQVLAPLTGLFEPVTAGLNALDLEVLLEPLNDWYAAFRQKLEAFLPSRLLQPLVDLFGRLKGLLASLAPSALVSGLADTIATLKNKVGAINLDGIETALMGAVSRVRKLLDQISPQALLGPLLNAFGKVVEALNSFDPAVLLEPFRAVFDALATPVANLTAEGAAVLAEIFRPIRELLNLFDPTWVFARLSEHLSGLRDLLARLNLPALLAEIKTPFDSLQGALKASAGPVDVSLSARVDGLNPLRDARLAEMLENVRFVQAQVQSLASGQPPAELVQLYQKQVRPRLELIVPAWIRQEVSAASLRRAFQAANPLALEGEIRSLYAALKEKLLAYDPRLVLEDFDQIYQRLAARLMSLDPSVVLQQAGAALGTLTGRLQQIDLGLFTSELDGLSAELTGLLDGLDPQPMIQALDQAAGELLSALDALQPGSLLAELQAPLQQAREIVAEFDPEIFIQALGTIFAEIQDIIKTVDVGILFEALVKRLESLRGELESNLGRTEVAFNAMLAAIPV